MQSEPTPWTATATAILLGAFAAGCATSYDVNVDALQNPRAIQSGYSYRIEPLNPSKSSGDEHFEAVAALVRTALSGRGMYEAPDGEEPSVIVDLDYGVGPLQSRMVHTNLPDPGNPRHIDPLAGRGGMINTDPRLGPIGTRTGIHTTSSGPGYREDFFTEKFLTIVGRDSSTNVAAGTPRVELWRVHVTVEDEGDDIAKYIAVLAAAATDYIGKETRERQRLRISENDKVVDFVKQGL